MYAMQVALLKRVKRGIHSCEYSVTLYPPSAEASEIYWGICFSMQEKPGGLLSMGHKESDTMEHACMHSVYLINKWAIFHKWGVHMKSALLSNNSPNNPKALPVPF